MAQQGVVRVLVERDRLEEALKQLEDLEVEPGAVEVSEPEPDTYRDERPDLELRGLVRAGRTRLLVGVVIGAAVGALLALLVPQIRDFAPISIVLLAFGGAWGGGAVAAARSVQVHRDEGPRGEQLHEVDETTSEQLRLVTVREVRDRNQIVDAMADRGFILLDSQHPRVGRDEPGQRPAGPGADGAGPPAP